MKQKNTLFKLVFLFFILLTINSAFAQQTEKVEITGVVTDETTGKTLPGATVLEKNTTNGTSSDINGKYKIEVNKGATIVFSFIGMNSEEKIVGNQTVININMIPSLESLQEVVIIGYGTQKKSDKTGAVATIKADELNDGVLTDPIQALQGKTAGVVISKKGGDPNAGFSVKIRGASGLFSSTTPLYVVDGVPGVDPTTIPSEEIKSFNVLKDASSTAIYGSRGANGVIIITTKSGNKEQGNVVEFNSYHSIDNVARRLDLLTADEMRQYASDHSLNMNDGGANTDWQDQIYRTGFSDSYNLAFSGGKGNTQYRASVTNTKFSGVVIGSKKERTIGHIKVSQKSLDDRLTLQAGITGTIEDNDYIQYSGNGNNDILYQAFQRNPTDPVYEADGKTFYETQRDFNYYNPVALVHDIQNQRSAKRLLGNLKADFEILEGLTAGVNLAYTHNDDESFYFEPSYVRGNTSTGFGRRAYNNFSSKLLETTVKYKNSFNDLHNINFVAGYSFQEDIYDGFGAQGRSPLSDYVMSNNLGVLNDVHVGDISSYKNSNKLISFFSRAVYNYNSKYFLTATVRRDGSSKFGIHNKWGWFPSASAAWVLTKEDFMSNLDFINQLKIRVGYGLSGNQEIPSYLNTVSVIPSGPTINFETGKPAIKFLVSHNANPDLKWEENSELNVGLDFGLFEDKISGSFEYYYKTTFDLLAPYAVPVPPNTVPTTWANVGKINNKGFEANIQSFIINHNNLNWKTSFNFSTNKQKVVSLSGKGYDWSEADRKTGWLSGRGLVGDQNWSQYISEGQELGTFYMPEYAGLSADGKFLFYTAAGGVTRDVDKAERRVVGHALPKFVIGWSNYFKVYKNFDVSFSLRSVYGSDVLNVTRMVFDNPSILPSLNALHDVLDESNKGLTDYPKISSYYLEDASFIKLDNVTIGYNFDVSKVNWLKKLRVYFTSNNLLTITKYNGIDPEISYNGLSFGLDQYNVYPKTRTFTLGVNILF